MSTQPMKGLQAVTLAAAAIERGEADVVIAGGSDSTSNAPLNLPQKAVHALAPLAFGKAATPGDYLGVLSQMMPITDMMLRVSPVIHRASRAPTMAGDPRFASNEARVANRPALEAALTNFQKETQAG